MRWPPRFDGSRPVPGLACFAGVASVDCAHSYMVVGLRKPREFPLLKWVNTTLGNLKTMLCGSAQGVQMRQ